MVASCSTGATWSTPTSSSVRTGRPARRPRSAGLVDPSKVLWGFAVRGYMPAEVSVPVIALWNDATRRGFPGYGWLFPGPDGANLGLGHRPRSHAGTTHQRAQQQLDAFCAHLVRIGLLDMRRTDADAQLGGWLKMGIVGTRPAEGRVLLVGDAAGLVNPLQGEGIAQALASGQAAARPCSIGPATPPHLSPLGRRRRMASGHR